MAPLNLEKNLPFTPDTLYGIASQSKSFCAIAILQLAEQGKLGLNAPVNTYIDFQLGKQDTPITIHHLLSHSSGLPDLGPTNALEDKTMFVPMSTEREFLRYMNQAKGEEFADPGQMFMYQNDMFGILALIVEKVSGITYREYLKTYIFEPLGMKRSAFDSEEFLKDADCISGYVLGKEGKMKPKEITSHPLLDGCGGLYSSANEMMQYMIGLMANRDFISQASLDKMFTANITPPKAYGDGYGYGVEVSDFFGHKLIGHGGNIETSGGYFAFLPEKNIGVVCGQIPNPSVLPQAVVRAVLAGIIGIELNKAVPMIEFQEEIGNISGKYATYYGATMEIGLKEMILTATLDVGEENKMTFPLVIEDLANLTFTVPLAHPVMTYKVQGVRDEKTGKISLQVDRMVFHKIA